MIIRTLTSKRGWALALAIGLARAPLAQAQTAEPMESAYAEPSLEALLEPSDEPQGIGPLRGRLFAYVRSPYDGPYQQISSSAWLEARPKLGATYAKAIVTIDALDASLWGGAEVRGALREGYVGYRKNGWNLRFGRQIIPWGSSDVVNPTDLLTARDYTFFSADSEVNQLGAFSAFLSYTPPSAPMTMTLVATPIFPGSRLIIPPSVVPPQVVIASTERPSSALSHTEIAVKLRYAGDGWDAAVLGFRGYNHLPELALRGVSSAGVTTLVQTYHEQSAIGFDGSANLRAWIGRLEIAYVATQNPDGSNPLILPSHLTGVVGLERAFFERLRVQPQVIARYFPKYGTPASVSGNTAQETAIKHGIAEANALLLNYQEQLRPSVTMRLAYTTADETLEAEVFGAVNLIGGDFVVRPMLSYQVSDELVLRSGYEQYAGPMARPLGALRPYSGAFLQGTFTF